METHAFKRLPQNCFKPSLAIKGASLQGQILWRFPGESLQNPGRIEPVWWAALVLLARGGQETARTLRQPALFLHILCIVQTHVLQGILKVRLGIARPMQSADTCCMALASCKLGISANEARVSSQVGIPQAARRAAPAWGMTGCISLRVLGYVGIAGHLRCGLKRPAGVSPTFTGIGPRVSARPQWVLAQSPIMLVTSCPSQMLIS